MFSWFKRARPHGDVPAKPFKHLVPGWRYGIVRDFIDHDQILHPIGQSWTFLRSSFLPYDDGLSLFVAIDGGAESQIRLQWRADAQGPIIDALDDHIMPAQSVPDRWTLLMTRDSVCMADDVDAAHAYPIDVARDADAVALAEAVLKTGYAAWVGGKATWSLELGKDRVVFGHRLGRRFFLPIARDTFTVRASDVDRVHVSYHAQADPAAIVARMTPTSA